MLHTPNELYTCYIVWLALVSICEIDVTSFSEDGRGVNGYVHGRTLGGVCGGGGGGVTPPQLFKIGRKSVPKNAYQITSSVPEHPIY